MRILKRKLVKVFHTKFQQNMWVYGIHGQFHLWLYADYALLWNSKAKNQNSLMTFYGSLPYQISTNFCKTFYWVHGRNIHLRACINQALLWISVNLNWNCTTTFAEDLPCHILKNILIQVLILNQRQTDRQMGGKT